EGWSAFVGGGSQTASNPCPLIFAASFDKWFQCSPSSGECHSKYCIIVRSIFHILPKLLFYIYPLFISFNLFSYKDKNFAIQMTSCRWKIVIFSLSPLHSGYNKIDHKEGGVIHE